MNQHEHAQTTYDLRQKILAVQTTMADLVRLEAFLLKEEKRLAAQGAGMYAQSFATNTEIDAAVRRARELERKIRYG